MEQIMHSLFAFFEGALSPSHILLALVIGIVLFGKRLPDIGRSVGKTLMEFKKGMKGLEDDLEPAVATAPRAPDRIVVPQRLGTDERSSV
jgi:sec-independent protein translocase protein TatA